MDNRTIDREKQRKTLTLVLTAAAIGAVYCVLTIALAPISYGPLQFRVSEALTVLPALTPAGIPGLIVGCFLANVLGPYGIVDVVCGTLATALAAVCSYYLRGHDFLVPLPPVLANGLIIGLELHYAYGVPGLWGCMGWVAFGELVVCYIIGVPLLKILKKRAGSIFQ